MNTRDLMDYGLPQLLEVARLLAAFGDPRRNKSRLLGSNVSPEWNPKSGLVFLVNLDFAVGVISEDGCLRDWLICKSCKREGWPNYMVESDRPCCSDEGRNYFRESA